MSFRIHKDKLPEETIKDVKRALLEIGIFPVEEEWYSFKKAAYSIRVKDKSLNVGSSGKGISKKYALASAYAELLERIQNSSCIPEHMGIMKKPFINYPNRIFVRFKDLVFRSKTILEGIFDFPLEYLNNIVKENEKVVCGQYYNVFDHTVESLPNFMKLAYGTNGFCAGNTPGEALCQGIYETLERYIVGQLYKLNFDFTTIPMLSIKELDTYSILKKITDQGYGIIIKDCTLNGNFLVLGLVILDKTRDQYFYAFGADPIFEIALQRCITEVFQGVRGSEILG